METVEGANDQSLSSDPKIRLDFDDLAVEDGVFPLSGLGRDLDALARLEIGIVDPTELGVVEDHRRHVGEVKTALHARLDHVSHELHAHRLVHTLHFYIEVADQVVGVSHWGSPARSRAPATARP